MSWLFRPTVLVIAWIALTLAALALFLRPTLEGVPANRALPRPLPAGDQEIVWLQNATNGVAWERFVAALHQVQDDADLGMKIVDEANAFPSQTTAVPEVAVTVRGNKARLWFRWYKLTGELDTKEWVRALGHRDPPPLAIIGGSSSDRARDLARELSGLRPEVPAPPLLLITTATADQVDVDHEPRDLMKIYEDRAEAGQAPRSFRFCFTNHQLAETIIDFLWNHADLRPEAHPVYLVKWKDDPYSNDLFNHFRQVLSGKDYDDAMRRLRVARLAGRQWAWLAGLACTGGIPPGLDFAGIRGGEPQQPGPFWSVPIEYSVGTFDQPNRWEAEAAEKLLDELGQNPGQHRPLLILPAAPTPARRFLRGLVRGAPVQAGQLVVASGDSIDFNTIYRDRLVAWPIQDLPFDLVFFSHRNPVDPALFRPESTEKGQFGGGASGLTTSGTQDLLLYRDILEAVVEAAYRDGRLIESADTLAVNLRESLGKDARPRFDLDGNRLSGSGEFVVCLRPLRIGDRVLPRAVVQVWNRTEGTKGVRDWVRVPVAGQPELIVDYSPSPATGSPGAGP